MAIQISPEILESFIETIYIEDIVLWVKAEGETSQCFKFGQKGPKRPVKNCVRTEAAPSLPADANEKGEAVATSGQWKIVKRRGQKEKEETGPTKFPPKTPLSLLALHTPILSPPPSETKPRHTRISKSPHPVD